MHRLVVITGLVVAAGLGCDGSSSDEGASSTTVVEATTSTSEVTTTTTVSFEVEVKRAAIDLLELRNEVFQAPDVSRVAEYIADTCVCLERERGFIERFEAEGLRWTSGPIEVRGISLSNDDVDTPTLTLVARQAAAQIVDVDGASVEEFAANDAAAYTVVLVRAANGQWRVNALDGITLDDETTNRILGEGLP